MAKDCVILSPGYADVGKREGKATTEIKVGTFIKYVAAGFAQATAAAALKPILVAVENVGDAGGLDGVYPVGGNVNARSVPPGVLINMKADPGTYNPSTELEISATGLLKALDTGVAVAVVPSFGGEVITDGGSLLIETI